MSRWLQDTGGGRGASYDDAFRRLAASGVDVHGEAACVAALVPSGARVLDAGCGTGRVAVELTRRGYAVTGVDSDPSMLAVARARAPELPWHLQDLVELEDEAAYDLVVAAGNVMVFLTPGTGPEVVRRLGRALRPGGLLVSGWRTERAEDDGRPVLAVREYDAWAQAAHLQPVARWSTWDAAAWRDDADWCVRVHRRPSAGAAEDEGAGED